MTLGDTAKQLGQAVAWAARGAMTKIFNSYRPRIFVSYRRDDSGGHTGRIRDRLRRFYGSRRVFQDVDTIQAGESFVGATEAAVAACDVQLVIIGPDWLTITGDSGQRRLDDPADFVALEVRSGLARGPDDVRVIPVLVGGASMPDQDKLPEALRDLVFRNAVELRDARWDDDLDELVEQIGGHRYRVFGLPRLGWVGILVAGLAVAAGLILPPDSPDVMTGLFRVAVAEFVAETDALDEQATQLSETVFRGLSAELDQLNQQGFDFGLREPARTGAVANADEAAELAEEIDADIVIYGTLAETGLRPQFYLRQRPAATLTGEPHFINAEELTGQYDLGSEILSSSIATGGLGPAQDVVNALSSRTQALAQFVIGLSWYTSEPPDFAEAQNRFEQALAEEGWRDEDGKEVLYLFLGNTAGKLGDFDAAEINYQTALDLSEGGYARAHIGAAEVAFQRSRGDCEQGNVDVPGLQAALVGFEQSLAIGAPSVSDIESKAALGKARVNRCLSQALVGDYWDEAEADLLQVIDDYNGGNDRIKELAAEAHAELALVRAPASQDAPGATAAYEQAADETLLGIELTGSDLRRSAFHERLGFFYERLGRTDEANSEYAKAAELRGSPLAAAAPTPTDPSAPTTTTDSTTSSSTSSSTTTTSPTTSSTVTTTATPSTTAVPAPPATESTSLDGTFVRRDVPPADIELGEAGGFLPGGRTGPCDDASARASVIVPDTVEMLHDGEIGVCGFGPGVEVRIVGPGGTIVSEPSTPIDFEDEFDFMFTAEPIHPLGTYRVTATDGSSTATARFEITKSADPRSRMIAPVFGPPGTVFRLGLAGYPANTTVDVRVYQVGAEFSCFSQPDSPLCAEGAEVAAPFTYLHSLDLAVDALGQGSYLLTSPDVPPGRYCLAPPGNCRAIEFSTGGSFQIINVLAPPSNLRDIGLFDPIRADWHVFNSTGSGARFGFGNPGDQPLLGDWDCDGTTSPGVYRDGTAFLRNSRTTGPSDVTFRIGDPGDVALAGDFDGDGCDSVSIYRPDTAQVFIFDRLGSDQASLAQPDVSYVFGNPGAQPVAGDFDGDGVDTIGVVNVGSFAIHVRNSHTPGNADDVFVLDRSGGTPIAGDWDADGTDTVGVWHPATAEFLFPSFSAGPDTALLFGDPFWVPIAT